MGKSRLSDINDLKISSKNNKKRRQNRVIHLATKAGALHDRGLTVMICEIVLTPNQAKRIISKAIIELSYVQKALQDGMMVIHPSSTTYFILYELFGKVPEGIWVSGVIKKGALCISRERQDLGTKGETPSHPFDFPFSWVLEKGKLKMERIKLGVLLNEMGPGDIYVKGCNAVDAHRQAGVLFASPGGGTVAQVMKAAQRKGFRFILPVGLEKMISIPSVMRPKNLLMIK